MFDKLIRNLPFNPSLINQVAFYAKRLRKETSIRRLGFLFIALTFLVQMFAVLAPPQPSVQASSNDLINGGFSRQVDVVNYCKGNAEYQTILSYFGISCAAVNAGFVRTISSRDYGGQLMSMGRIDYPIHNEQAVDVPGAGRYFMRSLWGWDSPGTTSSYQAVVGTRANGSPFMLLFNCGNVTIVGAPPVVAPPAPPPPPAPTPAKVMLCSALSMSVAAGSHVPLGSSVSLQGQATGSHLPDGQRVDMHYFFSTTAVGVTPTRQSSLNLMFGPHGYVNDTVSHTYTLTKPGHYIFTLAVTYDGGKDASGNKVGNCAKDVYVNSETCKNPNDHNGCVVKNKRASNITAGLSDANNTTAHAGDTIEYTLSATNTQKFTTVSKYVITENIGDILEYADVVNLNGGKLDSKNNVTWPAKDIKAGQTIQQKFTVKVKTPIPATPVSTSNPGSFDLTMTNSYGDTVTIHLPPPGSKIIESTATSLPNTGPGTNIFIGVLLVSVVGYFFARSRLLSKELDIVRVEYTTGA